MIGKTRRAGGKLLTYSFKLKVVGLSRKRISFILFYCSVFVLFCFFVVVVFFDQSEVMCGKSGSTCEDNWKIFGFYSLFPEAAFQMCS